MRRITATLFCLALAVVSAPAIARASPPSSTAAAAPVAPVRVRLVAATAAISPGGKIGLDFHFDIAPGWHIYWRNPGDSGLATEIDWKLPPGFHASALLWPVPRRFVVGAIGNYGYSGAVDLVADVEAPHDIRPGAVAHVAAAAHWLACSTICIPGAAALALGLPVQRGRPAPDRSSRAYFAAARAALAPQPAGFGVHFTASPDDLRLFVPGAAFAGAAQHRSATFFPFDQNVIDAAATPRIEQLDDGLEMVLRRVTGPTARLPAIVAGVLVIRDNGGAERAFTIRATPAPAAAAALPPIGWWQALGLAFLGGALLNLMPCVLPVLALKLVGFTLSVHRSEERRHALAYAAGIIVSFALLGTVLLLLRAGGAAIGWGFQLQSPIVVALLADLLLVLALSLSGVAEFGIGFGGIGSRFADRAGLAGAFATGVLAAVVATPCTAPFMGAALGFALLAPAPLAIATILAVGGGLAAPVLAAAAVPGIARVLPRPGPWMLWFKQLLAFPLYATVAWLIWVLMQEAAPAGSFLALAGLVAVGFAVWIYGRTRAAGPPARRLGGGLAAAAAATALLLAAMLPTAGTTPALAAAGGGLAYQRFAPGRLDALLAAHKPVFVNLTAAWCITCLVNERTTLDSAAVRHAFAAHGIVALKGDWTRQDPAITAFLQQFGRSGVPLYLLYGANGKATVLPQILTEGDVLAAVNRS